MKYVKEFATHADYTAYVATDYPKPNVSLCAAEGDVHYNPIPPPLCKLTLNNGEVVKIEGSGQLTQAMIRDYSATCVSAEIGEPCTSISPMTFRGCSAMTTCTIGSGVTSIGYNAFQDCTSLTSITIPSGITRIDDDVFRNCSSLTSITIPDSVTSIIDSAFAGCTALTTCNIGSGVTSISRGAFTQCSSLTNITIPNTVTNVGDYAFQSCSAMTTCTIGSGVTSIGSNAFGYCSSLSAITSLATTAPTTTNNTFYRVKTNGTLYVPQGSSGYDDWLSKLYYWTKVEQ